VISGQHINASATATAATASDNYSRISQPYPQPPQQQGRVIAELRRRGHTWDKRIFIRATFSRDCGCDGWLPYASVASAMAISGLRGENFNKGFSKNQDIACRCRFVPAINQGPNGGREWRIMTWRTRVEATAIEFVDVPVSGCPGWWMSRLVDVPVGACPGWCMSRLVHVPVGACPGFACPGSANGCPGWWMSRSCLWMSRLCKRSM